ncbi:hypothetical protein BDW22DRAFT_3452 [Trametopsis cervina]|nr:hypothetical protein BDW22DRAFT_3452 [Trametopsis cervina]
MDQLQQYVRSLFTLGDSDTGIGSATANVPYPPQDERILDVIISYEQAFEYVRPLLFPDLRIKSRRHSITGAHIPPEIFPDILYFVSRDDQTRRIDRKVTSERWVEFLSTSALILAHPTYTLKSCSLVSMYWANQCRRYMFLEKSIWLRNYRDAVAFRHYSTLPNSRLTPICEFIKGVHVSQVRPDSRSLAHIICLPSTQHKLLEFNLQGPISSKSPTPVFNPLHYSLPHRIAMPPSITSYREVRLVLLAFSTFHNVVSYIKNFRDAESLHFSSLTWNEAPSTSPVEIVRSPFRRLWCYSPTRYYGQYQIRISV